VNQSTVIFVNTFINVSVAHGAIAISAGKAFVRGNMVRLKAASSAFAYAAIKCN